MRFEGLRYNRKVNLVILYIILILSIINLAVYPGSRSKYMHAEQDVLTYGATLYYQSELELLLLGEKDTPDETYSSDDKTAYFKFEFEKNKYLTTSGIDEYLIDIAPSNGCTIVEINTNASSYSLTNKIITYEAGYNNSSATTNTVILKCEVDKIKKDATPKKQISVSVNIKEKVNNEEKDYISGSYTDYLENYYKKYPPIAPDIEELKWTWTTLSIPYYLSEEFFYNVKSNLESVQVEPKLTSYLPDNFNYSRIKTVDDIYKVWVQYIASGNTYIYDVLDYVTKDYTNIESVTSMPGLSVNHNDTTNIHEFTVEENLIGYARTYKSTSLYDMYFSTTDKDALDEAFLYYLNNYTYLKDEGLTKEEKELLLDYVKSFDPNGNNGIGYILTEGKITEYGLQMGFITLDGQTVGGLVYIDGRLSINETHIFDYANIRVNNVIKVTNDLTAGMMPVVKYGLINIYGSKGSNIISDSTINKITAATHEITKAIVGDGTGEIEDYGIKQFTVYDEEKNSYLLVEVHTDGTYTYLTVKELEGLLLEPNKLIIPEYYLNDKVYDELENSYHITNRDIYSIFKEVWLENIVTKYDGKGNEFYNYKKYATEIIDYIIGSNSNFESILNANIKGLNIKTTTINGSNIYQFELENLIGYIRTTNISDMYFTTTDMDALDRAFAYYLDSYADLTGNKLSEENKNLLINYVKSFDPSKKNGIGYILKNGTITSSGPQNGVIVLDGQTVNGMVYIDGKLSINEKHILDYANIKINKVIKVANDFRAGMMPIVKAGLRDIYGSNGSNIMSTNTLNTITAITHEIAKCITGDGTGVIEAYDIKQFTVLDSDKGYNLLVEVHSDGTYTYVTVKQANRAVTNSISLDETSNSEQELEVKEENVDFESKINSIDEVIDASGDTDPKGSLVEKADLDLAEEDSINDKDSIVVEEESIDSIEDVSSTSGGNINNVPLEEVNSETEIVPNTISNGMESISEINAVVSLS